MRALVLALVLTACGGDDGAPIDIHAVIGCDDAWTRNGYTQCETACTNSMVALAASGDACAAHDSNGPVSCSKTFVFEGVKGCCVSNLPKLLFGECD